MEVIAYPKVASRSKQIVRTISPTEPYITALQLLTQRIICMSCICCID